MSEERAIKPRRGLLKLAEDLGSVSRACKIMGYSRDSYYRYKQAFELGGEEALKDLNRSKPNIKNRIALELEERLVEYAIEFPAHGPTRVSNELRKKGVLVNQSTIRSVWIRNDLETMKKRLKALEAKVAQEGLILTEEQLKILELKKETEKSHGEIETEHPGYLGCQDTFYVGNMKGVGRIYQQTFIDSYSKVAICKLYDRKNALTAADHLNDKVIPFFDSENVPLLRILTDRGTEYCGNREFHEFQLYLFAEDIEHTRTKARSPQTNGIAERFHKTILNEFYATAFRKKIYRSIEELQKDLDEWMYDYNHERTHQGKYCYGKTPYQTFLDSKKLAEAKQIYAENKIEIQDVKVESRNSFADKNPSHEKGVFGSESNFVSSKGKSDQRLYAER